MRLIQQSSKIDASRIEKVLESLPDVSTEFSPEEDMIIKKYAKTKGFSTVGELLNRKRRQIYDRWRTLMGVN